jgi:sporulation protein YlmC with PRC-barrel domain
MTSGCSVLLQRVVIDAGGLVLGVVEDVLLDLAGWRVDALRVKLRREVADEVGVENPFFRRPSIDVPSHLVQSVGDAVILKVRADALHEASGEGAARHAGA